MPGKKPNKLTLLSGIAFLTAIILITSNIRIADPEWLNKKETAIISCSPLIIKEIIADQSFERNTKKKNKESGNSCLHQWGVATWINDNKRKGNHAC